MASSVMGKIGKVLLGLLVLVILAVGTLYALSARVLGKKYDVPVAAVTMAADSAALVRGEHLVKAVVVCRDCHGENFAGKSMAMGPMGTFVSRNLTGGQGGADLSNDDAWVRALRHGVRADGSPLLLMPAEAYTYLSDADLAAIVAYVRSQPHVDNVLPASTVGPIGRLILSRNPGELIAAEIIDHAATRPASVTVERSATYGGYLANIGGCTSCHTATLKGGRKLGPPGTPPTADLTSRVPRWTEEEFRTAIRTGVRPDGTTINPFMPWSGYRNMTDDEIGALYDFIRETAK